MKKTLLFSAFAAILLFTASCGDTNNGGGKEEDKPAYLLSKIKDADNGALQDFLEIKYTSTDPVEINELIFYHWGDESVLIANRKLPKTKADVISGKTVLTNVVKTATTMTFDVQMLETNSATEDYGSYNITLNAQGYASSIKFTSKMVGVEDNASTVKYNTDGYISEFLYTSESEDMSFVFTYIGADISKLAYTYSYDDGTEKEEDRSECVFTDYATDNIGGIMHPALLGSEGMFDVLTPFGILGKPAKMLPSKGDWSDGDIDTFTYSKDANDCISMLTYVSSYMESGEQQTYTEKYAYEYVVVSPKK